MARFQVTVDAVGNPLQVVRTGSLSETQSYGYDASDRLTSVCFQAGSCSGASDPFIRWSYDKVGNCLSEQRPSGTTVYSYDARDRLLQAGSTSYTYDENGNQLSAGGRTFAYDLANRLKSTTLGNTTTTYAYDGDGVRVQASTGQQANRRTIFLWDTSFGLPQLALERDGNGSPLRRYLYGVRRISQTAGNTTSYFLYDGLGSTANLTSSTGATQWTYAYEPFGTTRSEQKASGNQPANLHKFTGEYLDPTGLYHLRARQYDPQSGRFLTRDPADQTANDAVISAYAYVGNRPTVMVDPSGETFRLYRDALPLARVPTSSVNWQLPTYRCQAELCGGQPKPSPTSTPSLVHPIPRGYAFSVCQGDHPTDGLAGYLAWDFCASPGTPVVAVQTGVVHKWSGHDPKGGYVNQNRGVFGWSLYLRADSGADYYYTHLGSRLSEPSSGMRRVHAGQRIGTIGDWPGNRARSHLHLGVRSSSITPEMAGRAPRVRLG